MVHQTGSHGYLGVILGRSRVIVLLLKGKNIFKMLKDVEMAVPKIRQTRAVYMSQDKKHAKTRLFEEYVPRGEFGRSERASFCTNKLY